MNINKQIYEQTIYIDSLKNKGTVSYDKELYNIRINYVKGYAGKLNNVLDLCCGVGTYLLPSIDKNFNQAIGLDFSSTLLESLQHNLDPISKKMVQLVLADAQNLVFKNETIDLVFSFCSLYFIPNVFDTITEIERVLKPGGYAILEFGNSNSLNNIISKQYHKRHGWSKPYLQPISQIISHLNSCGFKIVEHRSFQILPLYGAPKGLRLFYPLFNSYWKFLFGIKIKNKMIDEWISSSRIFKKWSFRHLLVVKKLNYSM